jgi:phosphatidylethanolamine/phosphatidyl-N-methylethanolamine N-methyltransferase
LKNVNINSIRNAYRRYGRYYDMLFGPVLHHGRQLVINAMNLRPGDHVLEVGVGTGLSLPLYPPYVKVTGIDVSRDMLDIARERIARDQLENVDALLEMDAGNLRLANGSFDKAVAMYVMSVVPDPIQAAHEMRRVCKPAGEVFIVNHFHSQNPLIRELETLLSPLSLLAGFRPNMNLEEFIRDARLDVTETQRANLFGYWKTLRCRATLAPLLPDGAPQAVTEP